MKQKENTKHAWGRKALSLALLLGMLFSLSACGHEHTWVDATCTEPQTCSECGKTEGEALGHTWVDATCTEPKTCSVCGETEGEALGHTWVDATCTEPKTCSVCGETEGEALGHTLGEWEDTGVNYVSARTTKAQYCTVCGEKVNTDSEKLSSLVADGMFCPSPSEFCERLANRYSDKGFSMTATMVESDGNKMIAIGSSSTMLAVAATAKDDQVTLDGEEDTQNSFSYILVQFRTTDADEVAQILYCLLEACDPTLEGDPIDVGTEVLNTAKSGDVYKYNDLGYYFYVDDDLYHLIISAAVQ